MYKKISRSMRYITSFAIILTTMLILTASHNFFNTKLRSEIKNEAQLISQVLNKEENQVEFLENIKNERLILIDKDGTVLYGKLDDKEFLDTRLQNGNTLRVSVKSISIFEMLLRVLLPILIIIGIVYVVTVVLSVMLTENITKPINNINLTADEPQEAYEEIMPLVKRIALQNKEIKRQMVRIKNQKSRLQTISENMGEGLIVLDSDNKIISINSIAENIFGVFEDDALFKSFLTINSDVLITESIAKAYDGKKNWITVQIGVRYYDIFLSPIADKKRVSSIVMMLFDVTEKQKAQNMRQEFTANVSHELKTPLTTILGYTQLINQGIVKPEDISSFTDRILKETTRLIGLVDDILKLSKLDEGKATGEKGSIRLSSVVCDVSENLKRKAEENSIKLEVLCDESEIWGDLSQITELVYNLVDNAIKYNKQNGSVSITVQNKELRVSDTGIGIPEKYIENIWERFFRVDKSRSKKTGGTGLGLSIVKHIAICHNADVLVRSKLGEGTEFIVRF